MQTEGFPEDSIEPVKICSISKDKVMLAHSNGSLVFATHQELNPNSSLLMNIWLHMNKLNCIQVIHCQSALHDVELISCTSELWCGCDNGLIEIVDYSNYTSKDILVVQSHSSQLPQSSAITQITPHMLTASQDTVVFALHHPGNVISCWKVKQRSLVKVIPLDLQGKHLVFHTF